MRIQFCGCLKVLLVCLQGPGRWVRRRETVVRACPALFRAKRDVHEYLLRTCPVCVYARIHIYVTVYMYIRKHISVCIQVYRSIDIHASGFCISSFEASRFAFGVEGRVFAESPSSISCPEALRTHVWRLLGPMIIKCRGFLGCFEP